MYSIIFKISKLNGGIMNGWKNIKFGTDPLLNGWKEKMNKKYLIDKEMNKTKMEEWNSDEILGVHIEEFFDMVGDVILAFHEKTIPRIIKSDANELELLGIINAIACDLKLDDPLENRTVLLGIALCLGTEIIVETLEGKLNLKDKK
jgi:hypothetical protein